LVEDERAQLSKDQQRIGFSLILALDEMLDRALSDSASGLVEERVLMDGEGRFLVPKVASDRSSGWVPMEGEREEFGRGDYKDAIWRYRRLAGRASGLIRAAALNALARCAFKAGDLEDVLRVCGLVCREYPEAFDPDFGHLASYAHIRAGEVLAGMGEVGRAIRSLEALLDGMSQGRYPLYPGCGYIVGRAEELAEIWAGGHEEMLRTFRRKVEKLRKEIALVEEYGDAFSSLASGVKREGRLFLPGGPSRSPCLLVVQRMPDGTVLGTKLALEDLREALLRSPAGRAASEEGFLFSLGGGEVGEGMAFVRELGRVAPGMRLVVYPEDGARAMAVYRRKRLILILMPLALTGAIAFGGYLMARDAFRERKLSQLRSDFVSDVSHELKTPLTSIRMFAEMLLMKRFRGPSEQGEYLKVIIAESERLSRLVGNILDFSRMEHRRKVYRLRPEDPTDVVRSCLKDFSYIAKDRGFSLRVDIPDRMDPVPLDRDGIYQALTNLLSNAIKYSGDHKVIYVRMRSSEDHLIIEVADRGIGIPQDQLDKIFEPFYRIAQSGATGTGLGLALVDHVIRGHGGRVEVESKLGEGSTFRLVLPKGGGT